MDAKDLRSKSDEALKKLLHEAEQRLQELRFELSANQLKDVREVREVRRTIARIKTILTEAQQSSKETETPAK